MQTKQQRAKITTSTNNSEGNIAINIEGINDTISYDFDLSMFPTEFITKLVTIGIKAKLVQAIVGIKDAEKIQENVIKTLNSITDFTLAETRTNKSVPSQAKQDLILAYSRSIGADSDYETAKQYINSLDRKQLTLLRKDLSIRVQLNMIQNARIMESLNN